MIGESKRFLGGSIVEEETDLSQETRSTLTQLRSVRLVQETELLSQQTQQDSQSKVCGQIQSTSPGFWTLRDAAEFKRSLNDKF